MKKEYRNSAVYHQYELHKAEISEQDIIKRQIIDLVRFIPPEALYSIFKVEKQTKHNPYWQDDEIEYTVSITL